MQLAGDSDKVNRETLRDLLEQVPQDIRDKKAFDKLDVDLDGEETLDKKDVLKVLNVCATLAAEAETFFEAQAGTDNAAGSRAE